MSSLVVRTELERAVVNEGNPRNVENSSHGVVIDRLEQGFEVGNLEKQQVGDFPKAGAVVAYRYPSGAGKGALDSCEEAVAW